MGLDRATATDGYETHRNHAFAAAMLNAQTTPAELRDIAERTYLFAYPLVLIETTRGAMPVNRFTHVPQFPRPDSRQVISYQCRPSLLDRLD